MQITVELIKELREKTGIGIMDCKKALQDCKGDLDAATQMLKEQGFAVAEKKKGRAMGSGMVQSYIHLGGRIGALVEIKCETDFVARTSDFTDLVHDIAMQVAAMKPKYISSDQAQEGEVAEEVCLLCQPFIKDPKKTIQDLLVETIAKVGENIGVARIARFELGE
ncbi:MAG: elongation factor Ts [Dehalococcoidia bacterium]|nr:elongation factor Ts [Dehalococcoidia bacterium]